jgi:dTDP-4-amino-4,6-dideoxygalactose transaminase
MQGAKPVFVDIDEKTFNINTKLIKQKITKNTKAILPVHLYGLCSDMSEINKLAKEYNLKIIEDACQAHLSKYNNIYAGNLGDVGAFSLYATKNMMCSEGGLLTTNSDEVYNRVKRFRQHGMNQVGNYDYLDLGYNYRLTDINAAIALVQLNRLEKFTKKRQSNAKFLLKELKDIPGLILPKVPKNQEHCWHQFTVRITSDFPLTRGEFISKLKEEGIIPGIYYPKPLHLHPNFIKLGYKEGDFPVAEKLAKEVVSLPIHPQLNKNDLIKIVKVIKKLGDLI